MHDSSIVSTMYCIILRLEGKQKYTAFTFNQFCDHHANFQILVRLNKFAIVCYCCYKAVCFTFLLPFWFSTTAFTLIVPISIVRASPESCIPKIVKVSTWNEADNGPFADSTVSALWVIANQLCGTVIDSESSVPTKLLHLHVGSLLILQPLKKVTGDARSCFRPFQLQCSHFPWTKSKEDFAWYQHGCLSSSPPPFIPY